MHSTVSTCANAATVASRRMMDSECAVEDAVGGVARNGQKGIAVTGCQRLWWRWWRWRWWVNDREKP
jgi:hypothetical protein